MTRGEEPIDRIRNARNLVVRAASCWNAGKLDALNECVADLQQSALELRAAEAATGGHGRALLGARGEILQIKEGLARIERLSNLAATFLRGDPAGAANSPLYRPGGFEEPDSSLTVTTMIQA